MHLASNSSDSDQPQIAGLSPSAPPTRDTPVEDGTAVRQHQDPGPSDQALAQMKTAESLKRIHHDAFELLRFSQTFPAGTTSFSSQGSDSAVATAGPGPSSSRNVLLAMAKSSEGIASELRHMTARAAQAESVGITFDLSRPTKGPPDAAHGKRPHREPGDMAAPARRRRKSSMVRMTCHECHRAETPQWRTGPDGPDTLCNVCGLIYAKRKGKGKDAASCALSWPS